MLVIWEILDAENNLGISPDRLTEEEERGHPK